MTAERAAPGRFAGAGRAALLVVLAGAVAYSNSFSVPFQLDDKVVVLGEPAITGFHPDPRSRRFLGDLSFAVSYRLFGDRPAGYHAVNLAIHLASAMLVFWLVTLLWRTAPMLEPRRRRAPERTALLASLLFVAHPLQTQAVTYVVQRYASLAAAFFLFSTCSYVRFRLSTSRREAIGWYSAFLAGAAAAFWTKENALVLPIAALLVEVVFFSAPARRRLLFLSPFLAAGAVVAALALRSGAALAALDAATRLETDMPRADYLLTQVRVVARYLGLLALPVGQNVDHDVALSRSLLDPRVLLASAVHLALLAGAALALFRGSRKDASWRLVGFGVLWFYVTLLVESSFIPIVDLMFEHRVYLPSAGALLAAAALLSMALPSAPGRAWGAAATALVVTLAGATFARNRVWRSELALWSDAAGKSPGKARPLNNAGVALFESGDVAGAAAMYRRAISADQSYAKAYFNLGEALQKLGSCREAIPLYLAFVRAAPEYPDTYRNLAECYDRIGSPDLARHFRGAHERRVAELGGKALPVHLR